MPALPENGPGPGPFDHGDINEEGSEARDTDAATDSIRIQGLVDSDDEVQEIEPPGPSGPKVEGSRWFLWL